MHGQCVPEPARGLISFGDSVVTIVLGAWQNGAPRRGRPPFSPESAISERCSTRLARTRHSTRYTRYACDTAFDDENVRGSAGCLVSAVCRKLCSLSVHTHIKVYGAPHSTVREKPMREEALTCFCIAYGLRSLEPVLCSAP